MKADPTFAALLQGFFTRAVDAAASAPVRTRSLRTATRSGCCCSSCEKRLRKAPSKLALEDIDAPLVVAFLDELESRRQVTARTRNLRLTAIHSFFHYAAFEVPSHAAQIQRVLAIPAKRFTARARAIPEPRRGRCVAGGAGSAYRGRAAATMR